jgi:hypothetical protein
MPKNKVNDPITDQEIAFARLVLSGAITDRHAAEAVGLNPDSAAYTKAKPCVRAYMLEHLAAVDGQHQLNPSREQVLDRLWELAKLSPEMTRNSITGQVKAITLIIAMENFIPDRRAIAAEKKSAPAPLNAQIYQSAWLREQKAATIDTQPPPGVPEPEPAPGSVAEAPPAPVPSQPTFAHRVPLADGRPPYVPLSNHVPDTRVPFSIKVNPFKHRR